MLETFYYTFGFFGAILIAFVGFGLFIFWVAGIAGIVYSPESSRKNMKLIISIFFPPYPFFWMFYDINRERKLMQEKD